MTAPSMINRLYRDKLGGKEVVCCVSNVTMRALEMCFAYGNPPRVLKVAIPGHPEATVVVLKKNRPMLTELFRKFRDKLERLKPRESVVLEV